MSKAAVLQHYNARAGVHAKKTSTALLFLGVFQLDKKSDGDRGLDFLKCWSTQMDCPFRFPRVR